MTQPKPQTRPQSPAKPASAPLADRARMPRGIVPAEPTPKVNAMAKPSRISAPVKSDVAALSKPETFDRWKAGIRAATQPSEATITVYDVIGEDPWSGGGVSVNRIDAALRKIGNNAVEVHINSPGGDMFEGIAIYNRLLEHPAKVTVKVMGLAASAASIIAMAGDEVLIGPASFLMIHNCWVVAIGDKHDMQSTADFLAPFDEAMAGVYAARTGLAPSTIGDMLDAETWLNGKQAVDKGFADGLLNADDMQEDEAATAEAETTNAVRQAELQLCRSGSTRAAARALLNKIKGTPGAAPETPTPGAGDQAWADISAFSDIFKRP